MSTAFRVRVARRADIAAVDALLARSYPVLLKPDYPPSVMVTALPRISRARPELVTCGTYFVVQDAEGAVVGAGGWTPGPPGGGAPRRGVGHVRHVVTDHRMTRAGIGRGLMKRVIADAAAQGIARLDCLSTRTAVPFYRAMGFDVLGAVDVPLGPGTTFPSVAMVRLG